jgi:hypothetical protein
MNLLGKGKLQARHVGCLPAVRGPEAVQTVRCRRFDKECSARAIKRTSKPNVVAGIVRQAKFWTSAPADFLGESFRKTASPGGGGMCR